jgi:HK97 family phage prohead protease
MTDRQHAAQWFAETEFRSTDKGHQFTGYAALFDVDSEPLGKAGIIETIDPGTFRRALGDPARKTFVVDHNEEKLLSSTTSAHLRLAADSRGLLTDSDLPDTTYVRDLRELHAAGELPGMSFEFAPRKGGVAWSQDGRSRRLTDVKLFHVTVLTGKTPAYSSTSAEIRALADDVSADPDDIETLIDLLPSAMRERRQLDEAQLALLDRLLAVIRPERRSITTTKLDEARQILAR